ncbi:MAG: type II toxin-antitoxin system HipA family toxin [Acidimicrobiales bacterium]|nr:type II toxin-antitoxin system HipA family toxin [Acidimicrobiales bacterium]
MTTFRVHLDGPGGTIPVGTARNVRSRGVDTTEFTYDDAWLAGPGWAISPDLPVRTGRAVVEGLPGALADCAPDAWGRNLITRQWAGLARDAGRSGASPSEVDFLLGVHDQARQGALRLCLEDGAPFLADSAEVPKLMELERLLDASRAVATSDAHEAVATLLAAGSGSLGGARPKASVADGDVLHLAKFPQAGDRWDVIRWEAVALDLAAACGLPAPVHRLVEVGDVPVLLVERFDRDGDARLPYLSAQSLMGRRPGAVGDYLELAEAVAAHGSDVAADLADLWKRIAFSMAVNNVDDHLRNHGLLRAPGGWTLSPVFDVNPDPRPGAARATPIAGTSRSEAGVDALLANAARFGLDSAAAESHWQDVRKVVAGWRSAADAAGISSPEQDTFAPSLDRWAPD